MAKRIDVATLSVITGTLYPPPFDEPCLAAAAHKIGRCRPGLTQFGVNLLYACRPAPGRASATGIEREDEFVYVLPRARW